MEDRQMEFYALLDSYNQGIEPLENWTTEDLVKLAVLIDTEIQNREYNARLPDHLEILR